MLGGVAEMDAQGAPTHSALPFSTAYGSLAGPKLEDSDKVAMYTFCQILKRSRMTDDGPDLEAEKVLLNDFDWMMLSHWLTVLDKDPQSITHQVKSQLIALATEESRQTQEAPWGDTFDALPLSGFGYGHPSMGNEAAWTAVEAQVLAQSQARCATEGEGRVEGMVRAFLDIVINQHRLSHKFEFPHDPDAGIQNSYIRLQCIAPWIKQHMLAHPAFSGPPQSPAAEASRLVVFTSLLLFFNHVINFDGLWHRLRRLSEHWLVERQLQATSLRPLMLRQARSGDGMGGPMLLPDDTLERDEYILRTSAPPSPTAYPFQVVRLLQVPLPPTPEQACVAHHLKQLFFVGLNALLLDTTPPSPPPSSTLHGVAFYPHRMHQTLALLCHVAEERGLWGPFLLICPQAQMDTWANAAACLCPGLKTHLYRGKQDERAALRAKLQGLQHPCHYRGEGLAYTQRAPLHLVITSYRCIVEDTRHFTDATHPQLSEGVFQGLQWQYLIADHGLGLFAHPDARYAPFADCLLRIRARRRLVLTPTLHSPQDGSLCPLAPLLHLLLPSLTAALPRDSLSSLSPHEALRLRCLLYRLTCVYTGHGLMGPDHDVSTMASTVLPAPPPAPPTPTDPWLSEDLMSELEGLTVPKRPDCWQSGPWRGWWQEQWGDICNNTDFPPFAELSDATLLGLPKSGSTPTAGSDNRPKGVTQAYNAPWLPRLVAGEEEEGRAHKPRPLPRRPLPLQDQPPKDEDEDDRETSTDDEARAPQAPPSPSPSKKRDRPWAWATTCPHGTGALLLHLQDLMTPTSTTGPGLAKLWGQQFSTVLTTPTTVLGRLSRWSQALGTRLGVGSGLGQGFLHVDVNLADAAGQSPAGPTTPLAPAHASIHWDPASRSFLLRCLSPLGLLLNDRPIHPRMGPVPLPSRSLLYVGGHLLCFTAPSPSTPVAGPRKLPPLFPDSRAVSLLLQLLYDLMTPKVGPNAILPTPTPHSGGGGSKRPRKSNDNSGGGNGSGGNGSGGNGRPSSRSDNSTTSSDGPPSTSRKRPSSTPQSTSSPLSSLSPTGHGSFLLTAPLASPLSSLHPSAYHQSMAHAWKDLMDRQHPHALPPTPLLLLQQQQLQLQLQLQQHNGLYSPAMLQAAAAAAGLGSSLAPSPCHAGSAGPSPSSLAMTIPLHMPPRLPPFTAQPSPSSSSSSAPTSLDPSATRPTLP